MLLLDEGLTLFYRRPPGDDSPANSEAPEGGAGFDLEELLSQAVGLDMEGDPAIAP